MTDLLSHFDYDLRVVVIGASGGIGNAFVQHLAKESRVKKIYALSRSQAHFEHEHVNTGTIDISNEDTIAHAAEICAAEGPLDMILVASGILHDNTGVKPEKALRDLSSENFAKVFALNTTGPALIAKYFLPYIFKDRKSIFAAISARVGSITDNQLGGWYAYRASKAALNMILRTTAIEMKRKYKQAIIAGLHPGTVNTGLSKPFQGNIPEGKLFSPEYSAQCLLDVINGLTPEDSGYMFAWNGERIAY